ncbi:MAG: thiol-activated cytolysin family protein, partial [Ferruginibacter sp.]
MKINKMKITGATLLLFLTINNIQAQLKKTDVTKTKTTAETTKTTSVSKDQKRPLEMPQALGNYEARWNNTDGTVMKQSFKLKKFKLAKPVNNATSSGGRLKSETKSSTPEDKGNGERCITEEKRVTMSDNAFMTVDYAEQASHIYPGAIYKFDNYVNGSWKGEENSRNPIRINATVYNTTGKNYEDIEEPGAATIGNGIATLFMGFSKNPNEIASGSMSFTAYEVESMSDAMVKIGASGHGFGFYAKNLFQFNDKEHHKYILIDCTKEMFTINTSIPKNGFFTNTSAQTSDMMFINSVTYGVRILACMEIDTRDRAIADKFEGGGNWGVGGGQVNVDVLSKTFNKTSTIKMYVVGGKSSEVFPVYSIDDLKKRCAKIAETVTYNSVMPIKYQFKNLEGEV